MARLRAVAAAAAAAALVSPPAVAQTVCAPTEQLRAALSGQFGERQVLVAILTDEITAELWLRPDGASFSWVQTTAEGRSCIVQAGKDWMAVPGPEAEVAGVPG